MRYGDARHPALHGACRGTSNNASVVLSDTCDRMRQSRHRPPTARSCRRPTHLCNCYFLTSRVAQQQRERPRLDADVLVPQSRMRLDEARHEAHAASDPERPRPTRPGIAGAPLRQRTSGSRRRRPSECRREEWRRCTSRTARAWCRSPTRGRQTRAAARRSRARPFHRAGSRSPAAPGDCVHAR